MTRNINLLSEDEITEILEAQGFTRVKLTRNLPVDLIKIENQKLTRALEDYSVTIMGDPDSPKTKLMRARILLHLSKLANVSKDVLHL